MRGQRVTVRPRVSCRVGTVEEVLSSDAVVGVALQCGFFVYFANFNDDK